VTPQLKIRCSCGAQIEIPVDYELEQCDKISVQFYEMHSDCRESHVQQARAIDSIAQSLQDIFALIETRLHK